MIAEREIQGLIVLDERRMRAARMGLLVVTFVPLAGCVLAALTLWGRLFTATDAWIFAALYMSAGLGITVGFHRMLAHRAFHAPAAVRAALAIAGSFAMEMGVIGWVATHRRHHAYSDKEGDPHSPYTSDGILRGLWHAHMGWLFRPERTSPERWAPDLLADPLMSRIDRLFPLWAALSFVLPALIGLGVTRSYNGMVTALLWGGLVRIFLLHHVTFSINSICHVFGRRPYETKERSTNVWPLALMTFGESWHNNHHAYPSSAFFGHRLLQVDIGGWLIRALTVLGLARRVKRPGEMSRR